MLRILTLFFNRLYRRKKILFLLCAVYGQWISHGLLIQGTAYVKAPFVLVGNVRSQKNYIAAALLGTEFTWIDDVDILLLICKDEEERIEKKYHQPLSNLSRRFWGRTKEETILYDHEDLPYPFYNLQGFGKSGFLSPFQEDLNTQEANESLTKILERPIRGFVLQVTYSHLRRRRNKTSLDVMDFLLPYFKDAEAVKHSLAPSVSLVISGFGGDMFIWDSIKKQKNRGLQYLRQSMQACYTAFHQAEQGTESYLALSKQKAFYDIFLKNADAIKLDGNRRFDANDFELNFDKLILFDPKESLASVRIGRSGTADTTVITNAVATFEGIIPMPYEYDQGSSSHSSYFLWGLPIAGAMGVGYQAYRAHTSQPKEEENEGEATRKGAIPTPKEGLRSQAPSRKL